MHLVTGEGQPAAGTRALPWATTATRVPRWHLVPRFVILGITPEGFALGPSANTLQTRAFSSALPVRSGMMQEESDLRTSRASIPRYSGKAPHPHLYFKLLLLKLTLNKFEVSHCAEFAPERNIMGVLQCLAKESKAKRDKVICPRPPC